MRAEYGTAEGGSLAALTEAGADLHGTRIESFARSLERSRKMMRLLDAAIQLNVTPVLLHLPHRGH